MLDWNERCLKALTLPYFHNQTCQGFLLYICFLVFFFIALKRLVITELTIELAILNAAWF